MEGERKMKEGRNTMAREMADMDLVIPAVIHVLIDDVWIATSYDIITINTDTHTRKHALFARKQRRSFCGIYTLGTKQSWKRKRVTRRRSHARMSHAPRIRSRRGSFFRTNSFRATFSHECRVNCKIKHYMRKQQDRC